MKSYALIVSKPGPKDITLFPCSTQQSTEFILLINVKMPTIVYYEHDEYNIWKT